MADEEIIVAATRHSAAYFARVAPHHLRVMTHIAPLPRSRDIGEGSAPEMAPLVNKGADHRVRAVISGRAHPQVLARIGPPLARRVPHPPFTSELLGPILRLASEALAPLQAWHADIVARIIMFFEQLLRKRVGRPITR